MAHDKLEQTMLDAELTEQRGGWESPEALHDVARAFDGKWKVLFRIPFTKLEIAVFWRHE
jgi:hypothetical protein